MKEKKKKRPFDTVRVTSIARKINLNYMGRLFMTYITTDVEYGFADGRELFLSLYERIFV